MTRSTKPVLGRPVAALLLLATLCQGPALAFAQVTAPATPAAPTPPAAAAPSDAAPAPAAAPDPAAAKAEARARFDRGLTLLREEAWGPALAEFLASRKLYPTRNATTNAAICLRKLQRYDESLGDVRDAAARVQPSCPRTTRPQRSARSPSCASWWARSRSAARSRAR
jgi:hypothetical protein